MMDKTHIALTYSEHSVSCLAVTHAARKDSDSDVYCTK